ncbi:hypothetical protein HLRTI_002640, partial [Halorhabdus tiamatea SARL4B]
MLLPVVASDMALSTESIRASVLVYPLALWIVVTFSALKGGACRWTPV